MAGRKEMDLTTGRPFGSLPRFAIPVILGNLFQLFYTLADSVIVGKTLGAESLAAVGSTSIIIYFVLCFINGFTGGFGICLGQRCGARDERGMRKSIAVSIIEYFPRYIVYPPAWNGRCRSSMGDDFVTVFISRAESHSWNAEV